MSKGSLFWGTAVGKLGQAVYYRSNGEQRTRTYLRQFVNRKSPAQMANRVKWPNLVNFYRVAKPFIEKGLATKTSQSTYNKFISENIGSSTTYLTKSMAMAGSSIIAPYVVTSGDLGVVSMISATESQFKVEANFPDVTLAQLSTSLINQNEGLQMGDRITFLVFSQELMTDGSGYPELVPYYASIVLSDSASVVNAAVEGNLTLDESNGQLAVDLGDTDIQNYCVAVIVSRNIQGKLHCSTSRCFVVADVPEGNQSYGYGVTLDIAMQSYGVGQPVFLDTNRE